MWGARVVVAAALAVALAAPAAADPLGPPIEVELPPPLPGLPDPFDPPLVAQPDPALLTLEVPEQRPWMLFDAAELDALRARILGAPAGSVVADAWAQLLATVDDPALADRDGYLAGLEDLGARRWGRDDLALVAFVWRITGDDAYLERARQLLRYAVAISPDYGAPIEPGVDEFYIQRAHRLNGFALAYDLLADALPLLERLQLRAIVEGLARQHFAHANTAWWGLLSSGSNIGANNAAALGTAGLALWHEVPDARLWVARAEQLVRGYFHEGFDPEGAGIEGVLYGNYGMRIPTYLGHALARAGQRGFLAVDGLARHQAWLAGEVLPGGGAVNPMNDARYYEINPAFLTWSIAYGPDPALSSWLFDNLVLKVPGTGRNLGELIPTLLWYEPSDPAFDPEQHLRLAEDYAELGRVVVRSGWGEDDLLAAFEARQTDWGEGVHQNQDVGQFTLYSDGAKLVTDSRYANWLRETVAGDAEAARTSESEAHNLVVADGRGQDFWGKGDLVGFATTAAVGRPGSVDVAAADARLAWLLDQPARADRYFLYVRAQPGTPDYVVVADRFAQGGAQHAYTSYLHTDWRNAVAVDPADAGSVRVESGEVPGVGLDVDIHSAVPITTSVGSFTPDDAQDWARLGLDGRKTHPRIETRATGAAYEAIAVLAPTAAGESAPPVRRLAADGGIADVVEVAAGTTDTVLLATGDSTVVAAEGIRTDAPFAVLRRGPGGAVRFAAMAQGTFLEVDGERVLDEPLGPATVAVEVPVPSFVLRF